MNTSLLKLLYVKLQGLKNGEEGQDLVEYGLLVALIALVCIATIAPLGTTVNSMFSAVNASLS